MSFPNPNITPPSLDDWQCWVNGLAIGAGTPYGSITYDGLFGEPASRMANAPKALASGEFKGYSLRGGRDLSITGDAISDGTSLVHALMELGSATPTEGNVEYPFYIQLPGFPLLSSMLQAVDRVIPLDIAASLGLANIAVLFHSTDSVLYGAPSYSATVGMDNSVGGATFPWTFPLTFGAGGAWGGINAANAGNVPMWPILIVTGPCIDPAIENGSIPGGPALAFNGTLNPGDQLIINTMPGVHSVVLITADTTAGAPRRNWVIPGSQWFPINPGDNEIQFTSGDPGHVDGTLTVQWADAYIL
jgi:hypothetical protein